jgi:hypothetical protein
MMIRNVNNSSNGYQKGLFNKDYILSFNLERQNNILSKVRKQEVVNTLEGTYSCGTVNKNKKNLTRLGDNNKNKYLINFYLNKGICTGITKSSRRIQFNPQNVIFYSSGKESSIYKDIYNILVESTPFVSFNIITKLRFNENLNLNKKKYQIFNVLIENIPNISGMRKLIHTFIRLYNAFMDLFRKRKSYLLRNMTKLISIQLELNFLYSLYNFICFKIYYEESPSFMNKIGFIGKNDENLVFLIENFMKYLPNYNVGDILNSLKGTNDNYLTLLTDFVSKPININTSQLTINQQNEAQPFVRLSNYLSTENFKIWNMDILRNFIEGSLKLNQRTEKEIQTLISFFITRDSQYSIEKSQELNNIFSIPRRSLIEKFNIFIQSQKIVLGKLKILKNNILGSYQNLYNEVHNKINPNNFNYTTLKKIGYESAFGEIFMKNKKVVKKEKLKKKNEKPFEEYYNFMKIYKENLLQYYLYNFSLKLPENSFLRCFPKMEMVSLKKYTNISNSAKNFMSFEMEKIDNETLWEYMDRTYNENNDNNLYMILIRICDILKFYQDNLNFVHGDLHYDNILIENNTKKIYFIDFGRSSIKVPIDYSEVINEQTKKFNNWYLVDNIYDISYEQDIEYNDTNNAKSVDLILLIFRVLEFFGNNENKIVKLRKYLINEIPNIIKYMIPYLDYKKKNEKKKMGSDLLAFIVFRAYILNIIHHEKYSSINPTKLLSIQTEFLKRLSIFEPANFKQVLLEFINTP